MKTDDEVLRIRGWGEHFECSQSRNLKRMAWVPIRIKLAGDGYTDLLNHPNGAAHFGGWIALVEVGALCEPRGTLLRGNGKPHDVESLSRITRIPPEILAEAMPRLLEIGWLETTPILQDTAATLEDDEATQRNFVATRHDTTRHDTERNRKEFESNRGFANAHNPRMHQRGTDENWRPPEPRGRARRSHHPQSPGAPLPTWRARDINRPLYPAVMESATPTICEDGGNRTSNEVVEGRVDTSALAA